MQTDLQDQFLSHFFEQGTINFDDIARISDSDDKAETKRYGRFSVTQPFFRLFEAFAFETLPKNQQDALKYFLAISYENCESNIVTEGTLRQLIKQKKVDEASLVSLKKLQLEHKEAMDIDLGSSNQFPSKIEFIHDSRIFHQNALTKGKASTQK